MFGLNQNLKAIESRLAGIEAQLRRDSQEDVSESKYGIPVDTTIAGDTRTTLYVQNEMLDGEYVVATLRVVVSGTETEHYRLWIPDPKYDKIRGSGTDDHSRLFGAATFALDVKNNNIVTSPRNQLTIENMINFFLRNKDK